MKNQSLYFLEGLACVFVIFIHCNFPNYIGILVDVIARFAVPLFFLISGYFNCNSNIKKLKQRIIKLLKIFLIAILIYYIYNIVQNVLIGNTFNFIEYNKEIFSLKNGIKMILFNETYYFSGHLWFILALMYCYVFQIMTYKNSLKKYYKFIPLLLVVGYIINILTGIIGKGLYLSRNWLLLGLPFYLIGSYLKINEEKIVKKSNKRLLLIAFVGIFFSIIERVICELINSSKLDIYIGMTLFVVCIFIVAIKNPNALKSKFLVALGEKYSLYMYIIHYIYIYLFEILNQKHIIEVNRYILPIIIVILTYITSLIIGNSKILFAKVKKIN